MNTAILGWSLNVPPPASWKERQFWNKIWGGKPCVYPDKAIPGVGNLKAKTQVEFALGVIGTAEMPECCEVVQGRNRKCEWWSKGCLTLSGLIDSVGSSEKAAHMTCICVVAWEDMIRGYSLWVYIQVKLLVMDANRMCCLKSAASGCSKVGPSGVLEFHNWDGKPRGVGRLQQAFGKQARAWAWKW